MRILIVEDEAKLANSVARGLRLSSHAVDVALTLDDGRRKLGVESYDVLVLDVNLPDGSGFTLTRELRDRGDSIPILLLTARDAVEDRVEGLDSGADDYLVKPFSQRELEARLRALGRRPREAQHPVLHVGGLTIDTGARTVTVQGQEVALTTTEYSLLEYLAERAGQVSSREQISARVWDENYDPLSNIIDVYVARLRKKIEDGDGGPYIHTVRGAGYVLDPDRGV